MSFFRASRTARWLGLVLVAAFVLTSCGKNKEPQGPAMWHLSDADSDIYLFGTFHLLPENLDWQKPSMVEAFDQSSILILEADIGGATPHDVVQLIQQYGSAPPDKPLRSRLSPQQTSEFETLARTLGLDPLTLDPYQPWYAATILTLKYAEMKGLSADEGAEQKLRRNAEAQNKPIAYLETVEEQIKFLAGLPEPTQEAMFAATLKEITTSDQMLTEMQNAWVAGNTETIAALFDQSVKEVPDLYNVLVVERNKRWADEIEKLMAGSGKIFIAVGTGHLVGNDSVVALLRAQGLTVEGP